MRTTTTVLETPTHLGEAIKMNARPIKGTHAVYVWRWFYESQDGRRLHCDSVRLSDHSLPEVKPSKGCPSYYPMSELETLERRLPSGIKIRVHPLMARHDEVRQVKNRKSEGTHPRRTTIYTPLVIYSDPDPCPWCGGAVLQGGFDDSDEVPAGTVSP